MSRNDREQQLALRTIQQERELQELRAELLRLKSQSAMSSSSRPGSARARREQHQQQAASAIASASNYTLLYSSFPVTLRETAWQSHQPPSLEAHAAVAYKGRLWVFGGSSGTAIHTDTWMYSPDHCRWTRVAVTGNVPRGRYSHSAVVYKGSMIIYGGFGPASTSNGGGASANCLLSSVFTLDLEAKVWSEATTGHSGGHTGGEPSKGHSAVMYGNNMLVFGGVTATGRSNVVRAFDVTRQMWLPTEDYNPQLVALATHQQPEGGVGLHTVLPRSDIPAARSGHTAVVCTHHQAGDHHASSYESTMLVFGGRLDKYAFANDTFQYNPTSHLWSRLYCGGDVPSPRSDHCAVSLREHMVVFGGYCLESTGAPSFAAGSAMSAARNHHHHDSSTASAVTGASTKTFFSDCYTLNTISLTWRRVDITGSPRPFGLCSCTATLVETGDRIMGMMVVGGYGRLPESAAPRNIIDDDETVAAAAYADANASYGANSDVWFLGLAPAAQADGHSPRSQSKARPVSARSRPSTARTARDRSRSPSSSQGAGGERKPWAVNTCKVATTKLFGEPPFTPRPPPPVRSQEDIERIKQRLAEADVKRKKEALEALSRQYIKEEEPRRMTSDEQAESIDRLYYQQSEWRAEKTKQLEQKWIKREEPKRIDTSVADDMIYRLYTKAEADKQAAAAREASAARVKSPGDPERIADNVQRLYYLSREANKKREEELKKQYLFGYDAATQPKKLPADYTADMCARLSGSNGGASSSPKVSPRRR